MNIRLRNIPKYAEGNPIFSYDNWRNNPYYKWFINLYPENARILSGNPLNQRQDKWTINGPTHHQVDDLAARSYSNYLYTQASNKTRVTNDIQNVINKLLQDNKELTPEEAVRLYNEGIDKLHNYQTQAHFYTNQNDDLTGDFNRRYNLYYQSKGVDPGQGGIKYDPNNENIYGTQTLQRDVDLYQDAFNFDNPNQDRIHEIDLGNNNKIKVYKKENGHIGLFDRDSNLYQASKIDPTKIALEQSPNTSLIPPPVSRNLEKDEEEGAGVDVEHIQKTGFDWSKVKDGLSKILNNPNFHSLGRLAYNLYSNNKIYGEAEKAIKPNLINSYHTYRQVVGDEATKQAYYRRAAEGITKASRPMTSDADKQMAYQMEAQRAANELRAQGDLADNQMIQKTSDESNQHQWANTQRDNQVANANRAALNDYNARLHNLRAQHKAADASSIDNAWKEYQTRLLQKQKEQQAIEDQIFTYQQQIGLLDNKEYQAALDEYDAAEKAATTKDESGVEKIDYENQRYKQAKENLQKVLLNIKIKRARELQDYYRTRVVKTGGKITWKKKDDLLYRSARDVVEHFRKMTKLSYDSVSKRPKEVKLVSHPKGNTKKYQQGGVAPFLVYTPAVAGGETSSASSASSSSSKSSDSGLDLMKSLFQSLSTEGLPSDVNMVYSSMQRLMQRQALFGNELSTDDLSSMYIQHMQQINTIKFNKAQFDKAQELVINRDAGDEMAITGDGRVVVQNRDTAEVGFKKISEVDPNKESVLTNNNILNMRAYSSAFNNSLLSVVNNATSLNEISKYLKAQLPTIGTTEKTLDGLTQKDSNDVKQGLKILAEAPDGIYKVSQYTKTQTDQAEKALQYLYTILPNNMKNLLAAHTGGQQEALGLIATMINSTLNFNERTNVQAITGKAASKDGKSEGETEGSAGLAFVLGQGPRELIDFNTGTSNAVRVLGIKGVLQTKSKENLGQGDTLQDATKSQQGGYLEWNKATFGGSRLNSGAYNHIILNDSTIMGMDLPYTTDINGNEVPDFQMLRRVEEADQYISENNITNINEINKVYQQHQLSPKYTEDGKLNTLKYKRFAAIQATLDEDSLQNKNGILSDEVTLAGEVERDLYVQAMKKQNKDYDLSNGMWLTGWWSDKLYKGTIFIPYSEDIAFAALSSGEPFKQNLPNNAATIQQMQYAAKAQTYRSPDITLTQIKEN